MFLLAVKDNQPALHRDIDSYFETAPDGEVDFREEIDKAMAGSRSEPAGSRSTSTGSKPSALIPAPSASPKSPPSP